jgi:hypothetical protein
MSEPLSMLPEVIEPFLRPAAGMGLQASRTSTLLLLLTESCLSVIDVRGPRTNDAALPFTSGELRAISSSLHTHALYYSKRTNLNLNGYSKLFLA